MSGAVLIVDDEDPLREVLTMILESSGYEATAVPSCRQAKELLRAGQKFDFALIDLYMPGSNGLEMIDTLHRQHPKTRIVAMTGHPPEALPKNLFTGMFSVDAFLHKPLDTSKLLETLRGLENKGRLP
jgi:two-component system nitrogen regulation response regulator NtrX